jgi:hypothetical protein
LGRRFLRNYHFESVISAYNQKRDVAKEFSDKSASSQIPDSVLQHGIPEISVQGPLPWWAGSAFLDADNESQLF